MSKATMKNKITPTSSSGMSMSNFKSSQNYIWNTNAVLGKGATGSVFYGHNKHSGETVAVKCFNHLSHMRPYDVQKREFEVLKKVNHDNIVRLLAIEEENDTKHKVLVMELCTGGSLFNILDDPLNSSGLEEKEFLLVLKHLAAGMKHLRDMNIIHRDLKPGNIMKFVAEDGTSIYKLTDFGAARELDDDQQFMSLYGTEEYLHPDMYERAVLRKPVGKSFKANVDLWSIGVTLFHIATGSLPFRPYGGRKNKETMYKITTEKASGIISGTQTSENGEIKWSRNLPETCLLSHSVQPLITELLAGLLECDAHLMWSFEKFFSSVTSVLEHKVIFVFYVGTLSLHSIYCSTNEKIGDLKAKFETLFKIIPSEQILIWCNDELNQINSLASNINNILLCDHNKARRASIYTGTTILPDDFSINDITTSENVPLFLLNGQMNSKIKSASGPIVPSKFPDVANTTANTDMDAQYAKLCSSMAYTMLRQIDKFVHNYKIACSIPSQMLKLINKNIKQLDEKHSSLMFNLNVLKERVDNLEEINKYLSQLIECGKLRNSNSILLTHLPNVDQIKNHFEKLYYSIRNLSSSNKMDEKLEQLNDLWSTSKECDNTRLLISAQSKAKIYTVKIRESWLLLHKDKQIKSLNFHEEQLHQLEKIKLDNYCKKLSDLVTKEINPCLSIADKLEEWYQGAQVAYVKPQLIISELADFAPNIIDLENSLKLATEEQSKIWNILLSEIKLLDQAVVLNDTRQMTVNSLLDSTLINGAVPSSKLTKEIESLRESSQALKETIKEFKLVFFEVQSFSTGDTGEY